MKKSKILSLCLALSMILSMFSIVPFTASAAGASSQKALYCSGTGTTSYLDETYSDNISVNANLKFTEAINGEMSVILLKTDSIYYKFFANADQIGVSKYINNSVAQIETFDCSLSDGKWYELEIKIFGGEVIAKIGESVMVVMKDTTTALTSGKIGLSGTTKYAIDNLSIDKITGVPTLFQNNEEHSVSNSSYAVPVNTGKDYKLDFTMNVKSYDTKDWGIAARVKLRNGLVLHFMTDALAIEGVGSSYVYVYDDVAKRGNHLNEDVNVSVEMNGKTMAVYMNGQNIYNITSDNLNHESCAIEFGSWNATWAVSNVKVSAFFNGKTVYENTPSQNADFTIANNRTDYVLEFNMNVASFNSGNWGIAARVKLKNGLTLHFMNDALAVDPSTGYDYSWNNEAKIGGYLNISVPVKIISDGNSLTVYMSGAKVYSKSNADFDKDASDIVFSAWDVTWSVSNVKLTDIKVSDTVEKTFSTPRNLTDTVIPNFNYNSYKLDFIMNIAAFSDGWGRAARVNLGNAVIIHFMSDALAVEGVQDGYTYSYFDQAKMGNHLNTDVPVSITVNKNKLTVSMSGVEVYSVESANISAKGSIPVKFTAWDVTWTISHYMIEAITDNCATFKFDGEAPTEGMGLANGFSVREIAAAEPLPANVDYYNDFGGVGYSGMNTEGEKQEYLISDSYDRNYILETSVKINSIVADSGRGIKLILGNCAAASSGKTELWIGNSAIWACTNQWINMQSFDITPYLNKNIVLKVYVENDSIQLNINDIPVWQACDSSFASSTVSGLGFGSWDANYKINNIKIYSEEKLSEGITYYVDSAAAEGGNGLTPETAWKTLEQVDLHGDFSMNDKLLFKKGCEWDNSSLSLTGSGAKYHHIEVGSYGEGAIPVINRKGEFDPANGKWSSYAVTLTNGSYWTFKDIKIENTNPVNPGTTEDLYIGDDGIAIAPMRGGLMVTASADDSYAKNYFEIYVDSITIANIDCMATDEHWRLSEIYDFNNFYAGAAGIAIRADQSKATVKYNGIIIENCEGINVGGTPISLESDWKTTDIFNNVIIRNNYIHSTADHQVTGHGIYVVNSKNPIIEYNMLENLSNGIAVQVSNGALLQYNTVINADGYMHYASQISGTAKYSDGCSYDIETNDEGEFVLKNNISVGSRSGAFVAFDYTNNQDSTSANNAHTTIENNLSINDRIFFDYSGKNALYTFSVKNNTVYRYATSEYADYKDVISVGSYAASDSVIVENNILAYPGQSVNIFNSGDIKYLGNVYYGVSGIPTEDTAAINADPSLVIPDQALISDFGYSYCANIAGTKNFYNTGYFKPISADSACIIEGSQAKGAKLAVAKTSPIYGDANGDGVVNIKDMIRAKKVIAGENLECYRVSADVNKDEFVNSADLIGLKKFLVGAVASF